MQSVVIVGAGIGGLAAAVAFAQRGWQVCVLEQAQQLREVGAGLQVSPNGVRVLRALGLAEVLAQAPRAQAVVLRDYAAGRQVVRLDMAGAEPGYHFVHRADLVAWLAEAARGAGAEIRLGAEVLGVAEGAVRLADGTLGADVILGADGIKSVLRPALNGVAEPFFTGQVAWRAVVPNVVDHPSEAWVHMGPGRHLVSYPLRGGASVNLVAVEERSDWAAEGWSHRDDAKALRAAFAGFGGAARALLEEVAEPGLWGLFRHPVAARWHQGSVALLGDAAHPTLPFLAQGANLALEDAYVLAACAGQADGLARYEALRRARAERVIAAATGTAWKYHLRNPLVRGAAHLGLSVLGRVAPQRLVGQFDWLYGYDATAVA